MRTSRSVKRAAGWVLGGLLLMACGEGGPGALEGARGAGSPPRAVAAGGATAGTGAAPAGPPVTTRPHGPRVPAVIPLSDDELRRGTRVELRSRGAAAEVVVRLPARPRSYGYDPVLTVGDRTLTEYRYEDGDRTLVFMGPPAEKTAEPSPGVVSSALASKVATAPDPATSSAGSPVTLSFRGGHDVVRRLELGTLN